MRFPRRSTCVLVAMLGIGLLGACGPDGSTSTSASPTEVTSTESSPVTSVTKADFGSGYVGQPVAFWFWSPY